MDIHHNGSLATSTDFILVDKSMVRINVWFTTESTVSNSGTYYNLNLFTKGKSCRKWIFRFRSEKSLDDRIFKFITEDQLYTAYYNHWSKLNPVRLFAECHFNGQLLNFRVKEKEQQTNHFEY